MRLEDRSIAGFEALARWDHPKLGRMSPSEFIGIAEEIGLIVDLGLFVMDRTARQLALWQRNMRAREPVFDQRTDVLQIGMFALELILGRTIDSDEYPEHVKELMERAWRLTATEGVKPIPVESAAGEAVAPLPLRAPRRRP